MFTIKSQAEIDKMRKAGEVLYETLQLLKKNIAPGVTTKELDRIAYENISGSTVQFRPLRDTSRAYPV